MRNKKNLETKLELGKIPGEGKPRLCETFKVKGREEKYKYRVTGFYKEYIPKPENTGNPLIDGIINELEEEYAKMIEENNEIRIIKCLRDEAEFVSGYGICGTIIRIEDCEIMGLVNWDSLTIARERRDYRIHEYDLPIRIDKYWKD